MTDSNPTKKQHYLPQFYLKRFANEKKLLHVLDLENKRVGPAQPYPSVGYEHYFYAAETGTPDEFNWLYVSI